MSNIPSSLSLPTYLPSLQKRYIPPLEEKVEQKQKILIPGLTPWAKSKSISLLKTVKKLCSLFLLISISCAWYLDKRFYFSFTKFVPTIIWFLHLWIFPLSKCPSHEPLQTISCTNESSIEDKFCGALYQTPTMHSKKYQLVPNHLPIATYKQPNQCDYSKQISKHWPCIFILLHKQKQKILI